jgi:hypothetical protein
MDDNVFVPSRARIYLTDSVPEEDRAEITRLLQDQGYEIHQNGHVEGLSSWDLAVAATAAIRLDRIKGGGCRVDRWGGPLWDIRIRLTEREASRWYYVHVSRGNLYEGGWIINGDDRLEDRFLRRQEVLHRIYRYVGEWLANDVLLPVRVDRDEIIGQYDLDWDPEGGGPFVFPPGTQPLAEEEPYNLRRREKERKRRRARNKAARKARRKQRRR